MAKTAFDLLAADLARSSRATPAPAATSAPAPVGKGSIAPFDRLIDSSVFKPDELNRPYAKSVWVMRAIKKVAQPISAVPLRFYQGAGAEAPEITDPAFLDFWRAPAVEAGGKRMAIADVHEALVGWLKLAGEYFLVGDDSWLRPFARIDQRSPFIIARPDRMRHVVENNELLGWELTDGKGRRTVLLPEQVIHKKLWNPYDPWRGLSEYEAARMAAESDYLAGNFAKNLNASNGDQGVYVVAKGGLPDDTQREQIIAQLREKRLQQQRGMFRPVFLTGDISVEDPKVRVIDASAIAARLENRHEVALAFGVPPSMFSITASYSIGSASDRFVLISEECMPTSCKLAGGFAEVARLQIGKPVEARHDWDEHQVMQAVRRERLDSATKLWTMGVPLKEVSDYLRLRLPRVPGDDVGYLPFSMAPVGDLPEEPASDPALNEDTDENEKAAGPVAEMLKALKAQRAAPVARRVATADPLAIFVCACHGDSFPVTKARDPRRTSRWREMMAARRVTVRAYESRFNRELMKARAETLTNLQRLVPKGAPMPHGKAAAADIVFDLAKWSDGFLAAMRSVSRDALNTAGTQLNKEIGRDDPFKYPPEAVLEYARQRENKLTGAADSIWENIKEQLEEGFIAGETQDELSDRVRSAFNGISKERGERIALTETSAAYGAGRARAMEDAGVKWKQWLTSGNDNVRPAHLEADGQTVPVDEAFTVDGEQLMHPGDSSGSAGNVINCHCVSIAVAAPSSS